MFNWFNAKDELGLILSVFTKVHDKLESFIARTQQIIRDKEAQVAKHYTDLDVGKNALEKIKHILGG